jgi:hypothetical protein
MSHLFCPCKVECLAVATTKDVKGRQGDTGGSMLCGTDVP